MKPWPVRLAKASGFHKPYPSRRQNQRLAPSRPRASSPRHEQGGTLASSSRESARADAHSSPNRQPAVVGLAAPPYGLPSANPTTRPSAGVPPVPSSPCSSADADGRHVPSAPTALTAKRGWSAYADNRARSEFPLDPLPSRLDRPPGRPACPPPHDVPHRAPSHVAERLSAPREYQ